MKLCPVTLKQSCAFVAMLHRHNKPPRGHKFSIGLKADEPVPGLGDMLVGVAMVGRPVARALDNGVNAEVTRTCTDGTRNANSMLYGAAARACKAMGYEKLYTYTQAGESGASLRAAGFVRDADLPARGSWADHSVNLKGLRDKEGNGGVDRVRWVRVL